MLMKEASLDAGEAARRVINVIEDKKGTNIVLLDLRNISPIADYFVIATADNERQLRAIQKAIDIALAEQGLEAFHVEGTPESGWVLLDYSDLVIHVFGQRERDFYRLDALYDDAPAVVRIQ
jgi:ribosome-associated protein